MENSSGNRPLTSSELDAVSGGVKQADKGTSETVSGKGSGTVSGTVAGPGGNSHDGMVNCPLADNKK